MSYVQRPPMSKKELLNRLLSSDFKGVQSLAPDVQIIREGPSSLKLRFDGIDRTYILTAHIPRKEEEWEAPLPPKQRLKGKLGLKH